MFIDASRQIPFSFWNILIDAFRTLDGLHPFSISFLFTHRCHFSFLSRILPSAVSYFSCRALEPFSVCLPRALRTHWNYRLHLFVFSSIFHLGSMRRFSMFSQRRFLFASFRFLPAGSSDLSFLNIRTIFLFLQSSCSFSFLISYTAHFFQIITFHGLCLLLRGTKAGAHDHDLLHYCCFVPFHRCTHHPFLCNISYKQTQTYIETFLLPAGNLLLPGCHLILLGSRLFTVISSHFVDRPHSTSDLHFFSVCFHALHALFHNLNVGLMAAGLNMVQQRAARWVLEQPHCSRGNVFTFC